MYRIINISNRPVKIADKIIEPKQSEMISELSVTDLKRVHQLCDVNVIKMFYHQEINIPEAAEPKVTRKRKSK